MAVFSAIGTFVATTVLGLAAKGIAATIVSSIIAGGLALATAKVLGVFKPPNVQSNKDPGVKIQLPPATDNKIPVFYGRNITGGIIVDAGISNQNETMTYVIVLGEKTDTGTYTVNNVYRDDQTLTFGSGASAHIVQSALDPNGTASNKIAGKLRCRIYAGGTAASNQIFPTTNTVAATTMLPTITAGTNYSDLVYLIFQIDYDPEENLVGLGAINVDIENSLSEPSNVILDYLQNDRYGCGITSAEIDTTGFDDLYDYSTTQVAYTDVNGTPGTHDRWRIDGMLSTYVPVKNNIDSLCQSCSAFFTYNPKVGKFGVVSNRAATTAEKTAAAVYDDDNILSALNIAQTELYSLYNEIEAEHPLFVKKDQTDVVFISTASGDRNPNEPDNKLTTRYNLVNDNTRVHNLANIDLRQSRLSTVVEFDADYSGIQTDAGDIIKLTNTEFGFSDKLFRVMRVTEQENEDGMLAAKLSCLEYDDSVYTHSDIQQKGTVNASGIPGWWNWWGNGNIDWGNIYVPGGNVDGNVNVVDPNTGNNVDVLPPDLTDLPLLQGGLNPFLYFNYSFPYATFYDKMDVEVIPQGVTTSGNVNPTVYTFTPPIGTKYFSANNTPTLSIPLQGFGINDLPYLSTDTVKLKITGYDSRTGVRSRPSETANITVDPKNFLPKESIATYTAGSQLEEADLSNLLINNADVVSQIIDPFDFDITGVDFGLYSFQVAGTPIGNAPSTKVQKYQLRGNANVHYANTTTTYIDTDPITGVPSEFYGPGRIPARLDENTEILIDPTQLPNYNPLDPLKPTRLWFWVEAKNTADLNALGEVGYNDVKVAAIKITKNVR